MGKGERDVGSAAYVVHGSRASFSTSEPKEPFKVAFCCRELTPSGRLCAIQTIITIIAYVMKAHDFEPKQSTPRLIHTLAVPTACEKTV